MESSINLELEGKKRAEIEKSPLMIMPSPQAAQEESQSYAGAFIKSAVYGGFDGLITAFSIVASIEGAQFPNFVSVVLILGFSNIFGDALAMGTSDLISTKSEIEYVRSKFTSEKENCQKPERIAQMTKTLVQKGYTAEDAELVCQTMSKYKESWTEFVMANELGVTRCDESPLKNGTVTFCSFLLCGLLPLFPYIVGFLLGIRTGLFSASIVLTSAGLFLLGSMRAIFVGGNWLWTGLETVIMGVVTAGSAYTLGHYLEPLTK